MAALDGETCFQLYYSTASQFTVIYGMPTKLEGCFTIQKYIKEMGAPLNIHNDNSMMQTSHAWFELTNQYSIATSTTEPYHPQQNSSE